MSEHPNTPPPPKDMLASLLAEALRRSAPAADATDEEIAVVAERGLLAIPEAHRDRVLTAMAANSDGAIAGALMHAEVDAVTHIPRRSTAGVRRTRVHTLRHAYRFAQVGLAAAAAWALFLGIELASATKPSAGSHGTGVGIGTMSADVELDRNNTTAKTVRETRNELIVALGAGALLIGVVVLLGKRLGDGGFESGEEEFGAES